MSELRCACSECSCTVDAAPQNGKAYCCEACATGHRNGEACRMPGCNCAQVAQPKETNVDNALDETFPASDPISP